LTVHHNPSGGPAAAGRRLAANTVAASISTTSGSDHPPATISMPAGVSRNSPAASVAVGDRRHRAISAPAAVNAAAWAWRKSAVTT
jgi:hypothetical protein